MTLAELHDQLAPSFPVYVRKDLKTAIRVLAQALQCSDPEHCHLDHYIRPLPSLLKLVEDFLLTQGKKPGTVRNTKNYLRRFFRLAEAQHLLTLMPAQLVPRYDPLHRPPRPGTTQRHATYLLYKHWPPALQDAYMTFYTWATDPMVPGRPAHLRKRPRTLQVYRWTFEGYFGYLHYELHLSPDFDHLFDFDLVTRYVHWHVNECHGRPTNTIRRFLQFLLALTRQYRLMPDLVPHLVALQKSIPTPVPTYNKADAWVSLATLSDIGTSLWPQKQPKDISHLKSQPWRIVGLKYAKAAGLSLMLRLWTYIPYRQRNMREMELGKHLYKDTEGKWRITFRADELKIASKRGRTNVFDLPFPDTLVPILETYLALWRPILLTRASHPEQEHHVFLTQNGTPFQEKVLAYALRMLVYSYTGKHWHPHIIRTVWATEWLRNSGDFHTAAIMLNDTLETVISNYSHLLEEDVAEKAYRLIDARTGQVA
jgi:hypothetical protein